MKTATAYQHLRRAVLRAVCEETSGGEWFTYIRTIQRATDLPRDVVRAILRDLRNDGLLRYRSGLFNEDGEVAGAGYAVTAEGIAEAADRFYLIKRGLFYRPNWKGYTGSRAEAGLYSEAEVATYRNNPDVHVLPEDYGDDVSPGVTYVTGSTEERKATAT